MKFPPGLNWLGALAIAAVVIAGGTWSLVPQFRTQVVGVIHEKGGVSGSGTGPSAGVTGSGNTTSAQTAAQAANPSSFQCAAGRNGGATDVGVTATSINLASTLAESGIGASFLGDARYGMLAVVNQVNRQGGICGRRLNLNLVDDGWNATTGESDIRNFIAEKYFALAVVPSSEGLNAASNSSDIDSAGIPVIGTDGMLNSQYKDPWIWPVAASTVSTAHIAALSAYRAGSRTFGIVYDKDYRFGPEGATAFAAAVSRLGGQLKASIGIRSGQQSYSSEVNTFVQSCGPCDMTFMLLEPDTAIAWIKSDQSSGHYIFGSKRTAGPQPLFVSSFGQACGQLCNNMWVWTGYQAPYPPFDGTAADADYVNAIRSVSGNADVANQFLEGAYVGMRLLVQALQTVGPDLTRARLKAALDSMTFDSGLTNPLTWQPGNHFANTAMLGFTIQYSQGFNGFQYQQTGWVKDPWALQDH
ncbi:MAG TPA: ABC transporter substrate-binding protein [Candidatus Dormibacteraeota bacterium]